MGDKFEMLSNTKLDDRDILKLVELFPSQMSEFLVEYLIANIGQFSIAILSFS